MTEAFSINEIIELGIQIEFNGRDFYQTLAESEKDEKIRELFLFLKHVIIIFTRLTVWKNPMHSLNF